MVMFLFWPAPLMLYQCWWSCSELRDRAVTISISPLSCQFRSSIWKWIRHFHWHCNHNVWKTLLFLWMCRRHFHFRKVPLKLVFCTQGSVRHFREINGSWCQYKLYFHQVSAVQCNCPSCLNLPYGHINWTLSLTFCCFIDFISPPTVNTTL